MDRQIFESDVFRALLRAASGWGVQRLKVKGIPQGPFTFDCEGEDVVLTPELRQALVSEVGNVEITEASHAEVMTIKFSDAIREAHHDAARTNQLMTAANEAFTLLRDLALGAHSESNRAVTKATRILNSLGAEE